MISGTTRTLRCSAVVSTELKPGTKQECIPIGCVPTTVSGRLSYHARPLPCTPPCHAHNHAMHTPHSPHMPLICHACPLFATHAPFPSPRMPPPRTEFLTQACENITFPQLLLRTVIKDPSLKVSPWFTQTKDVFALTGAKWVKAPFSNGTHFAFILLSLGVSGPQGYEVKFLWFTMFGNGNMESKSYSWQALW